MIVSVTESLTSTSPKLALTWPPDTMAVTPGTDVVAITLAVMYDGSVSVNTTLVAFDGPLLVAVTV